YSRGPPGGLEDEVPGGRIAGIRPEKSVAREEGWIVRQPSQRSVGEVIDGRKWAIASCGAENERQRRAEQDRQRQVGFRSLSCGFRRDCRRSQFWANSLLEAGLSSLLRFPD